MTRETLGWIIAILGVLIGALAAYLKLGTIGDALTALSAGLMAIAAAWGVVNKPPPAK